MLLVVLFLLIFFLSFFTIVFVNNFYNLKISKFSFFYIFTFLQISLSPLTLIEINPVIYKYLAIFLLMFFILSFFVFITIYIKKNKKKAEIGHSSLLLEFLWGALLLLIISLLIVFLTKNKFIDHDAQYYISISECFNDGYYGDSITNKWVPYTYKNPQMYYIYGSLFGDNLNLAYRVLNPIIFFLFFAFTTELISSYSTNKHFYWLIKFLVPIVFIALLFGIEYGISSMNFDFQDLLLPIFLVILIKNEYDFKPEFIILSFLFFSSSSILLAFPFIVILLIKRSFVYGIKNAIANSISLVYLICVSLCIFVVKGRASFLSIVFTLLLVIALVFQSIYYKKFNYLNYSFFIKRWLWVLIIGIITIPCIIVFIKFVTLKNRPQQPFQWLIFLFFDILLLMFFFNKKWRYFTFYFVLLNLLVLIELIISAYIFNDNLSKWRVILALPGYGQPFSLLLIPLFIIVAIFNVLVRYQILNKQFWKAKENKKNKFIGLGLLIITFMNLISFPVIKFKIYTNKNWIVKNMNQFKIANNVSKYDKELLIKNIKDQYYFSEIDLCSFLGTEYDLTGKIGVSHKMTLERYKWQFYDFDDGFNWYYKKLIKTNLSLEQLIYDSFKLLNVEENAMKPNSIIFQKKNASLVDQVQKINDSFKFEKIVGENIIILKKVL